MMLGSLFASPRRAAAADNRDRAQRWFLARLKINEATQTFQEFCSIADAGRDAKWVIGWQLTRDGNACVITAINERLKSRDVSKQEAARQRITGTTLLFYEIIRDPQAR